MKYVSHLDNKICESPYINEICDSHTKWNMWVTFENEICESLRKGNMWVTLENEICELL